MKSILFTLIFSLFTTAFAQEMPAPQWHGFSDAALENMALANQLLADAERAAPRRRASSVSVQPFYEYGKTAYVVFSDDTYRGIATDMKTKVAANLPKDVTLIVYTQNTSKAYRDQLFKTYAKHISPSRLIVLPVNRSGSNDFWTRDNLPLPVFTNGQFTLVDALYYYNFEPDQDFAEYFNVPLERNPYFYEGGNFMANSRGDCIVVNRKRSYPGGISDTAAIPDSAFKYSYGCKTLTRLKHLKGIGHADEVVKFMSDDLVITDTVEYKALLEQKGFAVLLLPEADLNYETYINSLIVNDTVFVPVFGEKNDQAVLKAYAQLGFKTVAIPSRQLATQGQGGIHCITMNYPPAALADITAALAGF